MKQPVTNKFVPDVKLPRGENGLPDFSAFGEIVEMPRAVNKALDFSAYGTPAWKTDVRLDDLKKLTPSFPEQVGDIFFGKDGRPIGIYVAETTGQRTWQNTQVESAEYTAFKEDRAAVWENDPIEQPATRQTTLDEGELDFDGPNPFGERALDTYGQAVGQIDVNRRAIRDLIRGVNGGHCVCCFAALWRVCLSYSERVPKRMLAARPALF